jgi:hypothetical protein
VAGTIKPTKLSRRRATLHCREVKRLITVWSTTYLFDGRCLKPSRRRNRRSCGRLSVGGKLTLTARRRGAPGGRGLASARKPGTISVKSAGSVLEAANQRAAGGDGPREHTSHHYGRS